MSHVECEKQDAEKWVLNSRQKDNGKHGGCVCLSNYTYMVKYVYMEIYMEETYQVVNLCFWREKKVALRRMWVEGVKRRN